MNSICRVCLDKVSKLYPLSGQIINCDQDIYKMITYCTSIQVELCDDLPNGVCVPCFRTLRIAYNFIVQFKENHEKLQQERHKVDSTSQDDDNLPVNEDSEDNEVKDEKSKNINACTNIEPGFEDIEEEEEKVNYDFVDDQEALRKPSEEEYDYQDIEIEDIGYLVTPLDENGASTSSENYRRNVTVKLIKTDPPPEQQQPQTVVRRKIKIRFSCPVCPNVYFASFESGLVPHMSLHKENFQCNVCMDDKSYNPDSFLNHFMKCHRFQCPYCGKSFNRTGTLTSHIKTHSNFRYSCNAEGCTKSFPTTWTLKKHQAVHSTTFAYVCNECNLEFKTYDTFMYHQKKHSGKKFLCMCCGRTFMQSVHLKYHMQQHTGIKQFKCNMCVKSYTSSSQLKKHKRRHHPEEFQEMWVRDIRELEDVI